jgi:DNA invertase Pin-like site-specific DNA recombinase
MMMTTYAYLRVSTDQQDVAYQRYGLFVYANTHGLGPLQFVEDAPSGRLAWRDRAVGRLLKETVHAGGAVLFAEISRMARSTLQVLEMLEYCMRQGVSVHIAKQQLVLDGSIQSRITAAVLGLAAETEREMISLRTTEALAKRKAAGFDVSPMRCYRIVETSHPSLTPTWVDRGAQARQAAGDIGPELAAALKAEARRRAVKGCWLGYMAYASLIARKRG